MGQAITKFPAAVLLSVDTATASLTFPALATTPPVCAAGIAVANCFDFATACIFFAGTADGGTINYQAIGWRRIRHGATERWLPVRIAAGAATVGTLDVSGVFGTGQLACDTLTPSGSQVGFIVTTHTPADNGVAMLVLDVAGFDYIEIDTDLGSATGASVAIALGEP
ncbi:MAG: hypothetical protein V2A79_14705 [Planctomycetota bacterium]